MSCGDCNTKRITLVRTRAANGWSSPSTGVLDPMQTVLQSTSHETMALTQNIKLNIIAQPLFLFLAQLNAMPAMRKRPARGGKGAHLTQKRLRLYCQERNIREVDVNKSDYDWRLLLRTMSAAKSKLIIGPGVTGITYRLLYALDLNYAPGGRAHQPGDTGHRHIFEIAIANGDLWHVHYHRRAYDLEHFPFGEEAGI